MNLNRTLRSLATAGLLSALPGLPALAQAPAPELSLAYSSYHLRPATGVDQRLNGFTLGARRGLDAAWSVEAALSRQTATEAGSVDLTQVGLVAGPRYSRVWTSRWQGFAHALAGIQRLSATDGADSDHSTTLVLEPGIGVDCAVSRRVSLRAQEDYVWTHYAGLDQHSVCFFLGVVIRK